MKNNLKKLLLVSMLSPLILTISCGGNRSKQSTYAAPASLEIVSKYHLTKLELDHNNDNFQNFAFRGIVDQMSDFRVFGGLEEFSGDAILLLPKAVYNNIVDIFNEAKNRTINGTIADVLGINFQTGKYSKDLDVTAIIAGNQFYVEFQDFKGKDVKEWTYMQNSDIYEIQSHTDPKNGVWMENVRFFDKDDNPAWEHGTSHRQNYGVLGYPMYTINDKFAGMGVGEQPVEPRQIFEVCYNHNA